MGRIRTWRRTLTTLAMAAGVAAGVIAVDSTVVSAGTNQNPVTTLSIIKKTTGGDGTFEFSYSGNVVTPAAFELTTVAGSSIPGDPEISAIDPGFYVLSEATHPNFDLDDINCVGGDSQNWTWDQDDGELQITIEAGDQITCTFTNVATAAIVSLDKAVYGGYSTVADFPLSISQVSFDPDDVDYDCDCSEGFIDPEDFTAGPAVVVGPDPSVLFANGDLGDDDVEAVDDDLDESLHATVPAVNDFDNLPTYYLISEIQQPGYRALDWQCDEISDYIYVDEASAIIGVFADDFARCFLVNLSTPPDLELTKSVSNATPVAGTTVDYSFVVTNVGGAIFGAAIPLIDAEDDFPVYLDDALPGGLTWSAVPAGCTGVGSADLACEIAASTLDATGSSVTLTGTAFIPADTPSGIYTNDAAVDAIFDPLCWEDGPVYEVAAPSADIDCDRPVCGEVWPEPTVQAASASPYPWWFSDPYNNADCVDITVTRAATVTLTKTDNVATEVHPGDTYSYTLQAGNAGPSSILAGTHLTDDLPDGLSLVAVDAGGGWTCNAVDPVVCDYAPGIDAGANATPVVVAVALAAGYTPNSIVNTAAIVATYDIESTDPAPNLRAPAAADEFPFTSASASETTIVAHTSNLGVTKTASAAPVPAGGNVVWTITASNTGPDTALGVTVGDTVPSPLVVVSATSNEFTCAVAGNVVTCTKATLAVGETGTILVTTMVPTGTVTQSFTNGATISLTGSDPVLTNNAGEQMVMVGSEAVAPPPTGGVLPATGSNQQPLTIAALLVLVVGVGLLSLRRRRTQRPG